MWNLERPEGGPETPRRLCRSPVTGLVPGTPGSVITCLGPGKFLIPVSSSVAAVLEVLEFSEDEVLGIGLGFIEIELESVPWDP